MAFRTLFRRAASKASRARVSPFLVGSALFIAADSDSVAPVQTSLKGTVLNQIINNEVIMYSKTNCEACVIAKATLGRLGIDYRVVELDTLDQDAELTGKSPRAVQNIISRQYGIRTVPAIFVGAQLLGGNDTLQEQVQSGQFCKRLSHTTCKNKVYDSFSAGQKMYTL